MRWHAQVVDADDVVIGEAHVEEITMNFKIDPALKDQKTTINLTPYVESLLVARNELINMVCRNYKTPRLIEKIDCIGSVVELYDAEVLIGEIKLHKEDIDGGLKFQFKFTPALNDICPSLLQ